MTQTLVLVGCFTVFWTVYYMLEVYLSQRSMASSSACRNGACRWPRRTRKAREEGTELESVPLCNLKDLHGGEAESTDPAASPGILDPEHLEEGAWHPALNSKGTLDCAPQQCPPELLQDQQEQIC